MSEEETKLFGGRTKSAIVIFGLLLLLGAFLWGKSKGSKAKDTPHLGELRLQMERDSLRILDLQDSLGLCENNVDNISRILNKKTNDYIKIKQQIIDYEKEDTTYIGDDINAITPSDVRTKFPDFFTRNFGRGQ